jgi:hypothetical protein
MIQGKTYWIDDEELVNTLKGQYAVRHIGGYWFEVNPALSDDITWITSAIPVINLGVHLVNPLSSVGFMKRTSYINILPTTKEQVEALETMRGHVWAIMNCFDIGSDRYNKLMHHFRILNEMVMDRGYRPKNLSQIFDTNLDTQTDRLIAEKYEQLGVNDRISATALQELQEAWAKSDWSKACVQASDVLHTSFAEHAMYQAKRAAEHLRRTYTHDDSPAMAMSSLSISAGRALEMQEELKQAADPAQELLNKAKEFSNEGDPETAAHNLVNVYNNLRYQELWGAANTVKAQITELGYTVVDGFDDDEPAQVVKTV